MSKNREALLEQIAEDPLGEMVKYDIDAIKEEMEKIRGIFKECKQEAFNLHSRIELLTKERDHYKRLYEGTLK